MERQAEDGSSSRESPHFSGQHYSVAGTHRTLGGPNQSPPKQGLLENGAIKAARSPAPRQGSRCAGLAGSSHGPPPQKLSSRKQATLHWGLHFFSCEAERIPAWCGVGRTLCTRVRGCPCSRGVGGTGGPTLPVYTLLLVSLRLQK